MIKMIMIVVLGFNILHSSGQEPQRSANAEEELNLALILERIAKTSPEGLEVIKEVKRMTPAIQKHRSAKSLGEAIDDCINGRGQSVISPIGWEALKSDGPRWKVFFYFQDEEQKYLRAAWEYNQDRHVLIPIEFTNATKFWVRRSKNLNP